MKKPTFVFMDESGKKESDPYFVCGFLELKDNEIFFNLLQRVYDQIKNLSIRNRIRRVKYLRKINDVESLFNLAKSFNQFELKHYLISKENQKLYCDLIKVVFRKTRFRYTAIVESRIDKNYINDSKGEEPLYLKAFKLYINYCVKNPNYIFIPDSFDKNFDWKKVKKGYLPLSILPLDSKSCLQLQVVDIFSGLIAQALKLAAGFKMNNKDIVRKPVLETLENEIGKKIKGNLTVSNKNYYFSVWVVDWSKSKKK